MKKSFIKIICLALVVMMLLPSCAPDLGGQDNSTTGSSNTVTEAPTTAPSDDGDTTTDGSTEKPTDGATTDETPTDEGTTDEGTTDEQPTGGEEDTTTEEPTRAPESLVAPDSAKQVIFSPGMYLEKYFSGMGTGLELSLTEVDGKTVLKVFCKKKSAAKVTLDYGKLMENSGADPVNSSGIQNIVFMVRKGETGEFKRIVYSANGLVSAASDGTVQNVSMKIIDDMRKNNTWYISSIALTYNTQDILFFSDLSKYALGYSDSIKIDPENKVEEKPVTAPSEDVSLKLWFDHATERVTKYTINPTGKSSYTIQMAKNEIEACQFFLHSPTNRKITINLSDFTNENGDKLVTELGVEFYIEEGYVTYKGYSAELVYPDAVIPYASYIFKTEGGYYEDGPWVTVGPYTYKDVTKDTSQGFVIQARTDKNSKPGLYKATLEIFDAESGECIKMADVYTYVYNVTLSEETALDTVFNVWGGTYGVHYPGNQQGDAMIALYDFMLDYRLTPSVSGWDMDYLLCPDGNFEWLYNPRVTTVRVHGKEYYDKWKNDPIIKEKMYFYGEDEPGVPRGFGREIVLADGSKLGCNDIYGILTIMAVAEQTKMLESWGWTDYRRLVPFERNGMLETFQNYPGIELGTTINISWDAVIEALGENQAAINLVNKYKQEMIDAGDMVSFMSKYVNVWVPILFAFTPREVGQYYQGCYYLQTEAQDARYGEFFERLDKLVEEEGHEKWAYVACNPKHTAPYQNLLLFCDGTEPQTMMWSCFQEDVTGFLYWHISNYDYSGSSPAANNYLMRNPFPKEGAGDGLLFYPGSIYGQIDPIPSLRVIGLRDGIEDYQLLTMLKEVKGEEYAKEFASFVATSVITYTEDDQLLHDTRTQLLQILEAELNK